MSIGNPFRASVQAWLTPATLGAPNSRSAGRSNRHAATVADEGWLSVMDTAQA